MLYPNQIPKFEEVKELENGYAFQFPQSEKWTTYLTEFTTSLQKRYPVLTTQLISEPNQGKIWLEIRGPDKCKALIAERMIHQLRPNSKIFNTGRYLTPYKKAKRKMTQGFRYLTSPIRIMPDFLIIGVIKGGTTSLYTYLTQHPCIVPAFRKEPMFFNYNFRKGLARYQAQFPTFLEKHYAKQILKTDFATGEATPGYVFSALAPHRVFETIPNVKLIVLLRNPVDRALSHYHLQLRKGVEALSFEDTIEREEEKIRGKLAEMMQRESDKEIGLYLRMGIYLPQLKNWLNFFPKEQILILKSEDFYRNTAQTFKHVLRFLNLPIWEPQMYDNVNSFPYPKMNMKTRAHLINFFEPHNQRLYKFLGINFGWN